MPDAGLLVDVESEQLDRNVALIVEHGDDGVELLRAQLDEHGVSRNRPGDVVALVDVLLDDRRDDQVVFLAEDAAFAGVRVERGDRQARLFEAEALERVERDVEDAAQASRRDTRRNFANRAMRCHVADAHRAVRQHHHRVAHAGQVRQQLGVTFKMMTGQMQGLL